jgi:hypothetical protein
MILLVCDMLPASYTIQDLRLGKMPLYFGISINVLLRFVTGFIAAFVTLYRDEWRT